MQEVNVNFVGMHSIFIKTNNNDFKALVAFSLAGELTLPAMCTYCFPATDIPLSGTGLVRMAVNEIAAPEGSPPDSPKPDRGSMMAYQYVTYTK
jgi:hypothetical protein